MDVSHPVALKMFELGCSNQVKILLAFQTYMELCEVYVLRNVCYHFNSKLDIICLSSKDPFGKMKFYIPVNITESITLSLLSQWQEELIGDNVDYELFLVLRDATTTGVFYKFSKGFAAPLSLEAAQVKKSQQDNKEFVKSEICKSRLRLLQQAKEVKHDASTPVEA